eukprot:GILJ01006477.1.p1 GENE.GILJ01006477.1~~GILJ01006477.1.p1  ORF type:complete len:189 (-),score=10.04 GILJ01006477.1:225-791(-)
MSMDTSASDSNHDVSEGGMQMYFFSSFNTIILFKSWHPTGWLGFIASCVAVLLICILHEYLTTLRVIFSCLHSDTERRYWSPRTIHLVKTASYGVSLIFSYLIMLIAMTYNVGIFLMIPIGLSIGFYFFAPMRERAYALEAQAKFSLSQQRSTVELSRSKRQAEQKQIDERPLTPSSSLLQPRKGSTN